VEPDHLVDEGRRAARHEDEPERAVGREGAPRGGIARQRVAAREQRDRDDGEQREEAVALAVASVEGSGGRGRLREGRVGGLEGGWERGGGFAIRGEFGDRIEAVAVALAEAQVAHAGGRQLDRAVAQAVAAVDHVGDLGEHAEAAGRAVGGAEDAVGVVGVGLHVEGAHGAELSEVVREETLRTHGDGHGRVPLRALVADGAVGDERGVARHFLFRRRRQARQEVFGATAARLRARRGSDEHGEQRHDDARTSGAQRRHGPSQGTQFALSRVKWRRRRWSPRPATRQPGSRATRGPGRRSRGRGRWRRPPCGPPDPRPGRTRRAPRQPPAGATRSARRRRAPPRA
jgi:hypothetical protein